MFDQRAKIVIFKVRDSRPCYQTGGEDIVFIPCRRFLDAVGREQDQVRELG
jgi:hypothetical protein